MGPVVERLLLWVISQIFTADVIKGSEVQLIAFLRDMANKSPEAVLLNGLIDLLATALGVPAVP